MNMDKKCKMPYRTWTAWILALYETQEMAETQERPRWVWVYFLSFSFYRMLYLNSRPLEFWIVIEKNGSL